VQAPALLQLTTERDEAIAKVRSLEQRLRQLQQELVRAAPRALVSKVESLETRLEEKERELRRVLGDTRHLEDTAHAAEVQRLEALLAERDRQIVQFQRELDGFVEALAELQGAQAPELAM
jgi:regulator of replication initiation timing